MIIILFLLFSFSANAEVVEATGYGQNPKLALEDAKSKAIEMVAGSWVDATKKTRNGDYHQEVNQFTSGTIESYEVIEQEINRVTIKANVVTRKNNSIDSKSMIVNSSQLTQSFNNLNNQNSSGEALDALTRAIDFKVKEIKPLKEEKGVFYVSVLGDISYSKKWLNDYEEFSKLNKSYKFLILKTERVWGFAEVDYGNKTIIVKSSTYAKLPKRKDLSDELDFEIERQLELVFPLKSVENIKGVKIVLKSAEEISRELGVKF
jgi:hypothetical protein